MRAFLTTLVEIAGIIAITAGFGLYSLPLGLIAGGIGLILVGWRLA